MIENEIIVNKNNITFNVIDDKIFHQPIGYDFWKQYDSWENQTFNIFDKFLFKDKDFLDIGAWVGATSVYASFLSKKVICVEPDKIAFSFLEKNMSINNIDNHSLINKALSNQKELRISEVNFWGSSMTRVSNSGIGDLVETISFPDLISMGDYSLIKMDIEGYEEIIIPSIVDVLKNLKIPILISFHEPFFNNKKNTVKNLISLLSFYDNVLNDDFSKIDMDNLPQFSSYIFF